jgi:hypothetical protein
MKSGETGLPKQVRWQLKRRHDGRKIDGRVVDVEIQENDTAQAFSAMRRLEKMLQQCPLRHFSLTSDMTCPISRGIVKKWKFDPEAKQGLSIATNVMLEVVE